MYLINWFSSKDKVEKLKIFAFDITRENFIRFIEGARGAALLSGVPINQLKAALMTFNQDSSDENLVPLAQLIAKTAGYTKKGFLNKFAETGERHKELSPEDEEEKIIKRQAGREKRYGGMELPQTMNELRERQLLGTSNVSLNEAFHLIEKQTLLTEASESQWNASWPQLKGLASDINLEDFGELDLSQSNIDQLIEIYSKVLEGGITALLEATKALTDNIGTYYSARNRSKAQAAGQEGVGHAEDVKDALEKDPRYAEEK